MKRIDRDHYQLDNGHTFTANLGILGLETRLETGEPSALTHGYDGALYFMPTDAWGEKFTTVELLEIAVFMERQWNTFAAELRRKLR